MHTLLRLPSCAAVALIVHSAVAAQITVAGMTFDGNAAPDLAVLQPGSNPQFAGISTGCVTAETLAGLTAPESMTEIFVDDGLTSWCFARTLVRLDFLDNVVVNGPGADLVVFELGGAEAFELSVFFEQTCAWSSPRTYTPGATGFSQNLCGVTVNAINAASIDLSDFGVLPGATVRRVLLNNKGTYGGVVGADLALVLAKNSGAPTTPLSSCLLSYQQGVDSGAGTYLGTADTCLASDFPTTAYGAAALEYSDGSPERDLLMRFDGIVGASAGQIPPGAKIQKATLTVSTGAGAAASAGTHGVHRVLQPWNAATATWANSFGGNGVAKNDVEATLAPVGLIPVMSANATAVVDVTAAVQAWADGAANRGLVVLANTADGLGLQLAEATVESLRPALTVQVAGNVAHATAVASFAPVVVGGEPVACNLDASRAIGAPDTPPDAPSACCAAVPTSVTLGSGGSITLEFGTASISGGGSPEPDLWIYEIGPDVEDTFVELSQNLVTWIPVGKVLGATSTIDLDSFGITPLDLFRYVRLTDDPLEGDTTGCSPGADIDAVAALSPNPWVNLGASLPGALGAPTLSAAAPLVGGGLVQFHLANAAKSSVSYLVFGTSAVFLPFFGGTLVPYPTVVSPAVPTGPAGAATVPLVWPNGVPAGLPIWVQSWVLDASAPQGLAASNAIQSVTK